MSMINQKQVLSLQQKLSPQQIQMIKLLELPTMQLEQRIKQEIEENIVLEEDDHTPEDEQPQQISVEEYLREDETPSYKSRINNYSKDDKPRQAPLAGGRSLQEYLVEQLGYRNLSEQDMRLAVYLVGSIEEDNMELAEDFLKYLIRYALENCREDLEFMNKMWDNGLIERLNFVLNHEFKRLDYTEGVEILKASGRKFEFPCDWGCDLQSEHERYLVEEHFKRPVILINYPKQIKAFYMKQNEDGKTVRAMDVLFPKIGEIIGGSEREADYEKLSARVHELGMNEKELWWYLDTRRWGSAPHSGFGLGFERLLLFVTGMGNIRDVIPFPRTPKNAEF